MIPSPSPTTLEELHIAHKKIKAEKAPGIDGSFPKAVRFIIDLCTKLIPDICFNLSKKKLPPRALEEGKYHSHTKRKSCEEWIEVLKETPDVTTGVGLPDWELALCLLASWTITYIVCAKGVKSSGKASYFLAIFPYVILLTLLGRSATLNGSDKGMLYFITPRWEMLLEVKVWYAAITQCIFSLNIGFGTITMYASYNNFRHNTYRDAMIVATLDTFTSMLAGTIIFGILGNLATKMGVEIDDVVTSGTGLAFISYPEAIAKFDSVPWLFSILFFLIYHGFIPLSQNRSVSLFTAIIGFVIGLAYITPGGQWIFTMVDYYLGTAIFFFLDLVEIIAIAWWYGLGEICSDFQFMLKRSTGIYWRMCWGFIIPVSLFTVLIYFIFTIEPLTYEGNIFPSYIEVWGMAFFAIGVLQPFLWFFIEIFRRKNKQRSFKKVLESMVSHEAWGPKDANENMAWKEFKVGVRRDRVSKRRHWLVDKICVLMGI
ncbi:hypothetical protein JTB14_001142 [Gonioctena quinquepunctata]|nr:hypothetical protein JTB14_001142 [Gonioctena quinquepunctata]